MPAIPNPVVKAMIRTFAVTSALAGLLLSWPLAHAATPVHKCVVKGNTTYQSDPCPTGQPRPAPTVEQLNSERKRQLAAEVPRMGASASAVQDSAQSTAGFRCDGRKRCTQMTSCTEAKYFLANCPGVQMDGDHDGIPCEQQWCH